MNSEKIIGSLLNAIEKEESVINAWVAVKEILDFVKRSELTLRNKVIEDQFLATKIGTNNKDLENGHMLKYTRSLSYKVNEDELSNIVQVLEDNFIDISSLMKVKHELSGTAYKKLSEAEKTIVNNCLTITESAPKLEYK